MTHYQRIKTRAAKLNLLRLAAGCALATVVVAMSAPELSAAEAELVIKNHRFEPAELIIPAGERLRILVRNLDATPEEFESYELNREKIIPGGSHAYIYIGPLDPGIYPFFGEFNMDTAQGKIIAE